MLHYKFSKLSDFSNHTLEFVYNKLSKSQKQYIDSLNPNSKIQSLSARALLDIFLMNHMDNFDVSYLDFDSEGKPYLIGSSFFISVSHSHEFVACALSDTPVGIDIERVREVKDSVITRVCTADEVEYVRNNGNESFFTLWTLKEAYVKANNKKLYNVSDVSFVKDNKLFSEYLTGDIDGYKWALVKK